MALLGEWLNVYLQRQPMLLRHLLWLAQAVAPGGLARRIATRTRAVRDVFGRPSDFLMGFLNAPKLKTGRFLLGMDPGPQHALEKQVLGDALNASLETSTRHASAESDIIARALVLDADGAIDLASGYAEPVFVRSLAQYFGLPVAAPASRHLDDGTRTLALFIRTLGATIGSSHPAPFGLEQLAKDVAGDFASYLETAIRGARPDHETVIGRLLAASQRPGVQFPRDTQDIVRSVAGMLAAGAGFPKAFTHAVHELIVHGQMAKLRAAVENGDAPLVQAYVREALRFRPVFPLLVRYCPRATRIADDQAPAQTEIVAASVLTLSPLAAMFDSATVERADDFIVGRPLNVYFIFGAAPRSCLAEALIMEMFMPMFAALFRHVPGIVDAQPGRFRYDGAGLESYRIHIGRHATQARALPSAERRATPPIAPAAERVRVSPPVSGPRAACPHHHGGAETDVARGQARGLGTGGREP